MKQSTNKRARERRSEQWWRGVIAEQETSGETVAVVCRRHGVSTKGFYWRRRQLALKQEAAFTPIEVGMVNEYEVRCRNGRSVIVRGAVTPSVLASILSVAEGA